MPVSRTLRLIIHPYGGHNGFISNWRGHTWYERYLAESIATLNP